MSTKVGILAACWFGLVSATAISAETQHVRVEANLGAGCHIAATLPKATRSRMGGDPEVHDGGFRVEPLPASWKSNMGEMYFSLRCLDTEGLHTSSLAKFNSATNQWEKDLDGRFGEMTADERVMLDSATKLINISAVNARGYAAIEDDTIGEETSRQRRVSFCLLHEPKSICGGGFVGMLNDPKSDLTEHALDILRTIEFLPDVPAVGQ